MSELMSAEDLARLSPEMRDRLIQAMSVTNMAMIGNRHRRAIKRRAREKFDQVLAEAKRSLERLPQEGPYEAA